MMKKFMLLFLFLLFGCIGVSGPIGADSPEELARLYEKYHSGKDVKNMLRLYHKEGISKAMIDLEKRRLKKEFNRELLFVKVEEFNDEARSFFNKPRTVRGQTVAYNLDLVGQIGASLEDNHGASHLYGEYEGRYYFSLQTNSAN